MAAAEVLVVLTRGHDASGLPGRVVGSVPPSVHVLALEASELDGLDVPVPGAALLLRRGPDGSVDSRGDTRAVDELDEGARLFVEAWRTRSTPETGRVGDGLAWDAPGFTPPDRRSG